MIADRHHGDDLLAVEEQRQRPLHDDRGAPTALPVLIDAGDFAGEERIVGIGADGEFLHRLMMGYGAGSFKRRNLTDRPSSLVLRDSHVA